MQDFNVQEYLNTVWEKGDLDKISNFVSNDCVFRDVSGRVRLQGINDLTSNLRQWYEVFEDPRVELRRFFSDQSLSTICWDWVLSVKPSIARNGQDKGARIKIYGITIGTISDGKIVEEVNCTDMKELIDLIEGRREWA